MPNVTDVSAVHRTEYAQYFYGEDRTEETVSVQMCEAEYNLWHYGEASDRQGSGLIRNMACQAIPGAYSGGPMQAVAVRRAIFNERRRFAQDLHDQSGQELAVLRIGLKRLERHVETMEGRAHLDQLRSRVDQIGEDLHRIVENLLPRVLESADLASTVRRILVDWTDVTGIVTRLDWQGGPFPTTAEASRSLCRILQEALTNVAKHGRGVSRVRVRMSHGNDRIVMTFADDGGIRGPDPWSGVSTCAAAPPTHDILFSTASNCRAPMGLSGMRDRVVRAGGSFRLFRPTGGGLALCARFPHPMRDAVEPSS